MITMNMCSFYKELFYDPNMKLSSERLKKLKECSFEGRIKILPSDHPFDPDEPREFKDRLYAVKLSKNEKPNKLYHARPSMYGGDLKRSMPSWVAKCEPSDYGVSLWDEKDKYNDVDVLWQLTPCEDPEKLPETAYFDLLEVNADEFDVWMIGYLDDEGDDAWLIYQEHRIYQDIPREKVKFVEELNNYSNIEMCVERFNDEEFERFKKSYEKIHGHQPWS